MITDQEPCALFRGLRESDAGFAGGPRPLTICY